MRPAAAVLGLVIAATPALGLAARTEAVTPGDIDGVKSLDEVVVTGDRTLSAARKAIVEAEDRFYRRWNALNDDRLFDITCAMVTPTGSHLSVRVCQPRFVDESDRAEAVRALGVLNGAFVPGADGGYVAALNLELRRRTLKALNTDPELKRALIERARLQQHYEALRKEKFKDRWIVWN